MCCWEIRVLGDDVCAAGFLSPRDFRGAQRGAAEPLPCQGLVFLVDYQGTPICCLSSALSHFQTNPVHVIIKGFPFLKPRGNSAQTPENKTSEYEKVGIGEIYKIYKWATPAACGVTLWAVDSCRIFKCCCSFTTLLV